MSNLVPIDYYKEIPFSEMYPPVVETIEIPIFCVDENGEGSGVFKIRIPKPKMEMIAVDNSSLCKNPQEQEGGNQENQQQGNSKKTEGEEGEEGDTGDEGKEGQGQKGQPNENGTSSQQSGEISQVDSSDANEQSEYPDIIQIIIDTFSNREGEGDGDGEDGEDGDDSKDSQVKEIPVGDYKKGDPNKGSDESTKIPDDFDRSIFDIENLSEDLLEKLSVINVDEKSDTWSPSYGGPGEDITGNKQNPNVVIRDFIKVIQNKKAKKTIKARTKLIDPKKAVIEMIVRPHKIFDQRKFRKKRPQIYALIDTETSEAYGYGDSGVFLNQFAETCVSMGVITWRAHKLTKDFYLERNPDIGYKGEHSHQTWADLANIKKGSLIIFVGDGCLGTTGSIGAMTWKDDVAKEFAEKYNPLWIHYYDKNNDCGCSPKHVAMDSGWDFYYGIQKVNDLVKHIH